MPFDRITTLRINGTLRKKLSQTATILRRSTGTNLTDSALIRACIQHGLRHSDELARLIEVNHEG